MDERVVGASGDKSLLKNSPQAINNQSTDVERNGNLSVLLVNPMAENELNKTGTP